jgi:AmmeMemoRadiSam system protein A
VHLTQAQRVLLLNIARDGLLEKLTARPPMPVPAAGGTETGVAETASDTNAGTDASAEPVAPTDPELATPAGCFVSLHERITHRLRGCVGRLDPEMPLWRAVRETAGDVLRDPRFTDTPVTPPDVPLLQIEISVLSPPRQAGGPLDFDPMTDGIYLIHGGRSGFFLPQVARETKWSKQQLLGRLCEEKLGLTAEVWQRPEAKLFTFKVDVIGPAALREIDV